MEPRSDRLVQSGRKTRSCSQQSSGSGAEAKPCQSGPPPPPPPPPFTRAPLEDRSKYEKLFSLDDSDPEDTLDGEEEAGSHTHDTTNPPDAARKSANQGDEDSIGSATDLKNCSDEDLDDIQQSTLRDRMYSLHFNFFNDMACLVFLLFQTNFFQCWLKKLLIMLVARRTTNNPFIY